jgi:NTE family protein
VTRRAPPLAGGRPGAPLSSRMRRTATTAALLLAAALSACRTAAPRAPLPDVPPAPLDDRPPRVALVLGGGGARGFAHVGVLRVLEEARVPVELIVGTSVGSVVGALYAAGANGPALERMAADLDRDDLFDFSLAPALFGAGLASGKRLEAFVRERAGTTTFDALRVPLAAVATDLETGAPVVLTSGDVARAVRASSAIPGVFEPVELDGRLLVDGALAHNLPVGVARALGADVVVAVDVSALPGDVRPRNFVEVFLRAVNLVMHAEVEEARRDADVLLEPAVGGVGFIDFDRKGEVMAAGAVAARAALPRIRAAIEGFEARRRAEAAREPGADQAAAPAAPWNASRSMVARRTSRSTGFTRCASNPASAARSRSSSCP